jgi:hypothetical protein
MLDNIRIGMDIIADNERTFAKRFGRAPSAGELYSMHFLGRTGGPRVLGADPNAPVASVVSPKVIKANPELRDQTVGEFIASMQKKMGAVGDTALARRPVKEQGPGTVPMPQAPKETIRGRERLQPLAQDMVNQLGPNYQAALAAMALADTREDDEDDENSLSRQYRDQIAAQETEDIFSTPQRIAGLELGAQSPFPEEQQPVMMANGGFVDPMGVADSGPITADTRRALTTRQGLSAAEMMRLFQNVGREGVSNLESLARGSVSAVPGVVGDIESIFRDDKNRRFATTEEVERQYLPKRLTAPTKESKGFVEAGTFIDPTIALKAAKPIAKGAAAVGKSLASTTEKTAADMLEKMAPAAKPFYMVQEASPPITPPINFSSRLDEFVSQQKSPMNKSQFLGTLKGKFRDYDILRAEEALADLPDTQKLSPSDISNRLAAKYPVKDYKYSIVNPKNDAEGIARFFNTSDNPYKGQPLGVITLSVTPTEEAAKKSAMMDNVFAALTKLRDEKFVSKDEQKLILNAIEDAPPEAKQVMQATLDLYNKSPIPVLVKARELYVYPNLYSPETWKVALNDTYQELWPQTMTGQMDKVTLGRISVEKANEAVYREADALMKDFNLPVLERRDPGITFTGTDFDKAFESFYPLAQTAAMGVREGLNNFARAGGTAKLEREALYKGQHTSVTGNINNPVGFSRFSDHLVKLPDLGRIRVMYVNELQSDLYDDLMKKGPVTRDKLKDVEEAVDLSNQAYMTALKTFGEDDGSRLFSEIQSGIAGTKYKPDMEKLTETYGEKVKNVVPELLSMLKRSQTLNKRAGLSGDYTKQEAFAGMERSPQVVQQLLIKNVIGAGIDRGVNAVAFPGKESAQAQLYEKLPNNLKQAVKDLGPGFEIRPITLTDFEGNDIQHLAVVWGKEAADRIRNKGLPFKKGGMVEKSDYDNRKYI